jgi:hypothetical protein
VLDADPTAPAVPVRTHRPGELTDGWRIMLAATWLAAFFGFAAVWKVSEELGIGTWWLGPRADPRPFLVVSVPFVICVTMVLLSATNVRHLPALSTVASLLLVGVAVPDVSRSVGITAIELSIAVATLLASAASFSGRYRAA